MAVPKLSIATIAAIAMGILVTVTTLAALNSSQTIPLDGTITTVNVAVYSDSSCTQACTAINVGILDLGSTATQVIYVKNTGTIPETLSMAVSDWNPPSAGSSVDITWDQQGTVLDAEQSIEAVLTITVASNTGSLTNFSCNVTLIGTQ